MTVECKVVELEIEDAATELYGKFHAKAFKSFPKGQSAVPGVTSCATLVRLHAVSFDFYTRLGLQFHSE